MDSKVAVMVLEVAVDEVAVVVDVEEVVVVGGLEGDDALAVLDDVPVGLVVEMTSVHMAV